MTVAKKLANTEVIRFIRNKDDKLIGKSVSSYMKGEDGSLIGYSYNIPVNMFEDEV